MQQLWVRLVIVVTFALIPRTRTRRKRGAMRAMLFGLAVFLAGCMATRPEQWAITGDAETTKVKRDIYECKADAAAVSHRATASGGAIMPIVGLFGMRSQFNECMESRGYRKSD